MNAAEKSLPPAPRWDLETIFPGGSESKVFADFRRQAKSDLKKAAGLAGKLPSEITDDNLKQYAEFILLLQTLIDNISTIRSFAGCLADQNVDDTVAIQILSEADLLLAEWQKLKAQLEALAARQTDVAWEKLVTQPSLVAIRFYLDELRRLAADKMPVELEALALDLGVNGYHAWNRLYDKMAGDLRVQFEENGETKTLSLGQLNSRLSNPDRDVRKRAFADLTEAWESRADLAAMTLNSLAGFRLTLFNRRGWQDPRHDPLNICRLHRESLDAMWRVVARETAGLKGYIEAKKKLLSIDKFRWYDEWAPCGKTDTRYAFDEAGRFVVDNVRGFSSDMAEFIDMALAKRWIEAEDRPGKAGGGWCTHFGPFKQGRIFMTYGGSYENLLTLAHEFGHLYHSHLLEDLPPFITDYPMTLAETASIFNELLVTDAAMAACSDPDEKLMLLDQKLQQPYILFCNLHCRYIFERRFYQERVEGMVSKDRLNELMVEAQQEAFGDLLDPSGYHPLFWASKLHFYISDFGFYNFPYTFGFLFASGVYDRACAEGKGFEEKYRALLTDTGRMTTEEVAQKHLGVDLTTEDFWVDAVRRSLADVDTFAELAVGATG
jgi:pepF/M3 family oligoendopeptidase